MPEMIPGIEFDFGGGRMRVVPPLSLGALQRLQQKIESLANAQSLDPAAVATVVEALLAALKRNYPEITVEEVGELVDVGNMHAVMECVLDVAGIRRKALADAKNRPAQPAETPPPTGQV